MGGSSYSRSYYSSSKGKTYSDKSEEVFERTKIDKAVLPGGDRRIVSDVPYPIVIGLDVTGSMGDNVKIIYDKIPVFWGQLEQRGYLPKDSFKISFSGIGDAYTDIAPLQVTPFEVGLSIDEWLKKIWLEGGGGGQSMESYDLAALFYLASVTYTNLEKGFFFFICDEGPYPHLDGKKTDEIFKSLLDIFEVYVLHLAYQNSNDNKRIISDWRAFYGERVLMLREPKSVVDVMLGIIAMNMGIDKDKYRVDMEERGQTKSRVDNVFSTIGDHKALAKRSDNLPVESDIKAGLLTDRDFFRDRRKF